MAGNSKKPRKKHKPKYVARNTMSTFFGGMSGEHSDHLVALNIKNHMSLSAIATGKANRDDWDRLVGAINMANVMCEQGIGNEFRSQTIAARDALRDIGKRAITGKPFLCTGPELQVLNAAFECHAAQLENIRAIDVERAADEVLRRVRYGVNTTNVRAEVDKDMMRAAKAAAANGPEWKEVQNG